MRDYSLPCKETMGNGQLFLKIKTVNPVSVYIVWYGYMVILGSGARDYTATALCTYQCKAPLPHIRTEVGGGGDLHYAKIQIPTYTRSGQLCLYNPQYIPRY